MPRCRLLELHELPPPTAVRPALPELQLLAEKCSVPLQLVPLQHAPQMPPASQAAPSP